MSALFDQPAGDLLDAALFVALLVGLIVIGLRLVKQDRMPVGVTVMFPGIFYFGFAFFYFTSKLAEGRTDMYVDWVNGWQIQLTDLLLHPSQFDFLALVLGIVFLYFWFVDWCGKKAEAAGRSRAGFTILAILLPIIAWIVVLIMKPEASRSTN